MNRIYAESQNGKYIDERECESAEELLVEYKNASMFFGMLKNKLVFDEVIDLYEKFNSMAEERKTKCFSEHKIKILSVESALMEKSIFKLEEKII